LESTYYELLRIYANALDRENALLLTFGFSFGDEHIRDITKRALRNPTLRVVAFAYGEEDRARFAEIFDGFSNLEIVSPPEGAQLDFVRFNELLRGAAPSFGVGQ
jgi:SIR2-like domain